MRPNSAIKRTPLTRCALNSGVSRQFCQWCHSGYCISPYFKAATHAVIAIARISMATSEPRLFLTTRG